MSLSQTHDVTYPDGSNHRVAECHCNECDNRWWVRAALEFRPSYCPYCGIKFLYYEAGGEKFGTDGRPL